MGVPVCRGLARCMGYHASMSHESTAALPDLFTFDDGRALDDPAEWPRRRAELLKPLMAIEYGPLPPTPTSTRGELLATSRPKRFHGAKTAQYRVVTEDAAGSCVMRLDLTWPEALAPCPVILTGDGCWRYVTDEVTRVVLEHGYMLAEFSRTEVVPDIGPGGRAMGLHTVYGDAFGAIAAWAWGYHRCVDVLGEVGEADAKRIAVIGHSRGGKASLLAGATDERIALTAANDSGCGGAGCFRVQGEDSEDLAAILKTFPQWFAKGLAGYVGREEALPFDQHGLKAAVAPRPLLTTEALGDLWANPRGTWASYEAARAMYRFLGVEDRIGIHYRPGGHALTLNDFQVLLSFADWHLRGIQPGLRFDRNPFEG